MTHRNFTRTALWAAGGVLVGAGALIWSAGAAEIEVPARPDAVTIHEAAIPTVEEPLPQIQVPELVPQPLPGRGSSGIEIDVPPRPELMLTDLSVETVQEPFPGIVVPELDRPCSALPRAVTT